MRVQWRRRVRAARWPAGMGLAAWRWLRTSRRIRRRRLRTEAVAEVRRIPRRPGGGVQDARQGVGPVFQRRYTVRIAGSPLGPAELITRLGADLNAASPVEVAVFDKTSGGARPLEVEDEYVVHMPGPWNCPVRVVERTPESFRFATLRGHLEAGEIEFRAARAPDGDDLVFTIESWARSGERLAAVLYEKVGIAKEMQLHMWAHFCTRVAELAGGRMVGEVEVQTERASGSAAGESLVARAVTGAVTGAFKHPFALAARVRSRPLHPEGLLFDATLLLHGTSQYWGVPFLDDRTELPAEVRLSRAMGLPSVLPDILGLALRWRQPSGDDAELLLATTGLTVLGRRLLHLKGAWSPAFYGSLLPYRAGDRRLILGAAVHHSPSVPADLRSLDRAVRDRPFSLTLLVASEFGGWERFGELRLLGLAPTDPRRFNPARNPVEGLEPAGLLQQVRGPTYAAVQRASRKAPR
ncbi:DUF1990 family protein [Actinomadura sp. NAK00032]|uniref:DUF1990 family protein n=1 Tax=Actinomadura sp. NAK00032 TaxID=2742128 RepID=UPI001C37A3A4|nr:DUF1990 family protein [Actinomadura sp. NAK00032]